MPNAPLPGGATWDQQVQQYAQMINQQWPPGPSGVNGKGPVVNLGDEYIAYMHKHPNLSPLVVYNTVVYEIELLGAVPKTLGTVIGAGGKAVGQDVNAAVTALKLPTGLAAIGDFFARLGQANTWLRVAEFVVGAILVVAGLNALLKQSIGVDPVGTVTKTAKLAAVA